MRNKLQVAQNKCFRLCLKVNSRQHIGAKEFKKINWLPTKERVEQRIATKVFKYWKSTSPLYVNKYPPEIRITLGHLWFADTFQKK